MNGIKNVLLIVLFFSITSFSFSQAEGLKENILFYSSFDGSTIADIALGDKQIYTAENYKKTDNAKAGLKDSNVILAKGKGLFGDAMHFKESKTSAIFYKAYKNLGYSKASWSGTISFWLRLDPNKELPPHYCDPIVISDKQWNDAALWIDFTDHNPRQLRYGAIGDKIQWNANDDAQDSEWIKRTIVVNPAPFTTKNWTHVAMVFSKVNTKTKSTFKLYLNGEFKGVIKDINNSFTWEAKKGKIMLGLGYIGFMDELTIFDKALNSKEITSIFELRNGIKTLLD